MSGVSGLPFALPLGSKLLAIYLCVMAAEDLPYWTGRYIQEVR